MGQPLKGVPEWYYPPDLEPVPTLVELHTKGLASVLERNSKGEPTILRPTPEGQKLMNEAMSRNAARMKRRHDEGLREDGRRDE